MIVLMRASIVRLIRLETAMSTEFLDPDDSFQVNVSRFSC